MRILKGKLVRNKYDNLSWVSIRSSNVSIITLLALFLCVSRTSDEGGDQFHNALSQRSRDYRKRREHVSFQINMIGWIVESIGQWLLLPLFVFFGGDDMHANLILAPIYYLFQTILVPYTQLLNEDRIKKHILRSGWLIAMRSVFKHNQNTVEPQPSNLSLIHI